MSYPPQDSGGYIPPRPPHSSSPFSNHSRHPSRPYSPHGHEQEAQNVRRSSYNTNTPPPGWSISRRNSPQSNPTSGPQSSQSHHRNVEHRLQPRPGHVQFDPSVAPNAESTGRRRREGTPYPVSELQLPNTSESSSVGSRHSSSYCSSRLPGPADGYASDPGLARYQPMSPPPRHKSGRSNDNAVDQRVPTFYDRKSNTYVPEPDWNRRLPPTSPAPSSASNASWDGRFPNLRSSILGRMRQANTEDGYSSAAEPQQPSIWRKPRTIKKSRLRQQSGAGNDNEE